MDTKKFMDPEDYKSTINTLDDHIRQGWILYGSFMDAGDTKNPLAVELRYTIDRLEKAKANLILSHATASNGIIPEHIAKSNELAKEVEDGSY
jgi:hypothetical protein